MVAKTCMSEWIGDRKQSKASKMQEWNLNSTCLGMLLMLFKPLRFKVTANMSSKISRSEKTSSLDPWQALNWPY